MAASQEQKVDFLLKKIGYTASKTGIAEDETGISGTKKAPFAEPIPSPLTLPGANVWSQSNQIPATPPGATTSIVRVYKTGTAQQLTFDSTVADNRSFVARETAGEVTSTVVGDWIDTQFGADYIVKVYKGDPNAGGTQVSAAGSTGNDTWFFDYSAGVLNFNGTNVPSGITTTNIYIEGYRYTGIKGVTGVAQTFTDLEISGITTFNGAVDMNSTLDVDGDTQLDDLTVAGVATFSSNIDANGTLDVDGDTQLDDLTVAGVATFSSDIDANAGLNVSGLSTFTEVSVNAGVVTFTNVSSVPSDSLPAGTGGHIYSYDDGIRIVGDDGGIRFHSAGFARWKIDTGGTLAPLSTDGLDIGSTIYRVADFYGQSLDISGISSFTHAIVAGVSTFTGAIDANGTLDVDGHTELDDVNVSGAITATTFTGNLAGTVNTAAQPNITSLGTLSAVTVSGNINANGNIVGDSATNITGIAGVTASTLAGTLQTAAQPNITSLGTLSSATVSGNINANGNIVGDNSTNISGINSVTVTDVSGVGGNFTGIVTANKFIGGGINTEGTSSFTDLQIIEGLTVGGISTFNDDVRITAGGLNVTGVVTATSFSGNLATTDLTGTITNAQLAGSIANDKLSNSTVSYGGVSLALGSSDATPAFDLSDATNYPFTSLTGITTSILGDATPTLGGDLNGNSKNIFGVGIATASKAVFTEGGVTDYHILIDPTTPTRNGTIKYSGSKTFMIEGGTSGDNRIEIHGHQNSLNILCEGQGETELYYNGRLALQTQNGGVGIVGILTAKGVNAIGVVTATSFSGNLATTDLTGTITNAQLAGSIANDKLSNSTVSYGGVSLSLGSSDATPAFDLSDATNYPTSSLSGTITNAQLAGSIANDKLANSTVSYGGISLALGGTDATPAFDLSDATNYPFTSLTGITTSIVGDTTPTLGGNLDGNSKSIFGVGILTATSFSGTLITAAQPNVTSLGTLSSLTVSGNINANGNIVGDSSTNITGIAGVTASTLTGTLQTAAQPNITSVGTLSSLNVTGNVSVGGTLTYEDVTNIDSVGLVTARNGVRITAGGLDVTGVSTFSGNITGTGDLTLTSTDTGSSAAPIINLFRNSASPADADYLGQIKFQGESDTGVQRNYAKITGKILDASNGTEDGIIEFAHIKAGSQTITGRFRSDSLQLLNGTALSVAGDITANGNIAGDGSTNITGINEITAAGNITANGNIIGDNSTNISGINSVTATSFFGNGVNLSGVGTQGSRVEAESLTVSGISTLGITSTTDLEAQQLNVTGVSTFRSDIKITENRKITFHSNSTIEATPGVLNINAFGTNNINIQSNAGGGSDGDIQLRTTQGGRIDLTGTGGVGIYHTDTAKKLETTSTGAVVTGILTATSFSGSSSGLTGIANANIASDAAIAGTKISPNFGSQNIVTTGDFNSGSVTITGGTPAITFTDSNNDPDYYIQNNNGALRIFDSTNSAERFVVNANGSITLGTGSTIGALTGVTTYYGDGSNLTGITATGIGAIGGLTVKNQSGSVVGTAGSISTLDFNGSSGVTVTATSGAAGIATIAIIGGFSPDSQENLYAGTSAGAGSDADTCFNVALGFKAACTLNEGDHNVALGTYALKCTTSGVHNVMIGSYSGRCNQTGSCNIAIGRGAMEGGDSLTSGTERIAIGRRAMKYATGSCSIGIGPKALAGASSGTVDGTNNIGIGRYAGELHTTGSDNVFLGQKAGRGVSTGGSNIAMGRYAMSCCTVTGSNNIVMGCAAGLKFSSANNNIVLGAYAMRNCANVTATNTVAIGPNAGRNIQSAQSNILIGIYAGGSVTTSIGNVFVGAQAGCQATGANNVSVGKYAGCDQTAGDRNIIIGCNAQLPVLDGSDQVLLSNGGSDTNSPNTVFYGCCSGGCTLTGIGTNYPDNAVGAAVTSKLSVGIVSAYQLYGDGSNLTGLAGFSQDDQGNLVAGGGAGAAKDADTCFNILLGCNAGKALNSGDLNFLAGCNAGQAMTSALYNIAIGGKTLCSITGGYQNIALGYLAGQGLTSGTCNMFIGAYSGFQAVTATQNTGLGVKALRRVGCTGAGLKNVAIGADAGYCVSFGCANTLIGYRAGHNTQGGSDNVLIGCCVCNASTHDSCCLKIGIGTNHWIAGVGQTSVTIAGIATVYNATGIVSATAFYGDGSNLSGVGFSPDAQQNLYAGTDAGAASDADTCFNIGIGDDALKANCAGDRNFAIGVGAGKAITSGNYNLLFGFCAGSSILGVDNNIMIGKKAGECNRLFSNNLFIGSEAGRLFCRGSANVAIGYEALKGGFSDQEEVDDGVFVGKYAGKNVTTSLRSIFIGKNVGLGITDGCCDNIFIGHCVAGGSGTEPGGRNTFMGRYVGKDLTTGDRNLALGDQAIYSITTGNCNMAFGISAGPLLTEGIGNLFLGEFSGKAITTGQENIAIGYCSGMCWSSDDNHRLSIAYRCDDYICGERLGAGRLVTTVAGIATFYQQNGNVHVTGIVTAANFAKADGSSIGGFEQDSQANLVAGDGAGAAKDADTCFNIMIGCNSGAALNEGDHNILMGLCSGKKLTSGCQNVFLGQDAGCNGTTVNNSVFIGNLAGKGQSSNGQNVSIGYEAMCCGGTGYHNVTLGARSGKCITSGHKNIAIGFCAMSEGNVAGSKNVAMGVQAGAKLTNGGGNVFFGSYAGCCTTVKDGNTFIGCAAGQCNTGGQNTFIGNAAGCANGGTCFSIAIGCRAGYLQTAGDRNIVIGCKANVPVTTGSDQIALVGGYDGTGFINYFIGCCNAGYTNVGIGTTRPDDVVGAALTSKLAVGVVSAYQLYGDGSNLTGLSGFSADDQENLVAGTDAGAAKDADTCFNIMIGKAAGCEVNAGDNNVILGCFAGSSNESGSYNVLIGQGAGKETTSGCNVLIGRYAGRCITSGSRNVAIGNPAGGKSVSQGNATGSYNTTIGDCSGINLTSGAKNTFLGHYTGVCNTTGSCNTAIGTKALGGQGYITGSENIAIGNMAGCGICGGSYNIFAGSFAGKSIQNGGLNVVLGACAGCSMTTGAGNVLLGSSAGKSTNGTCNVMLGLEAGKSLGGHNHNIFIGTYAACAQSAGNCNIAIGCKVSLPISSGTAASNQLIIGSADGNWIAGNCDFNVGIGTTNPSSRLSVAGDACITGVTTFAANPAFLGGSDGSTTISKGSVVIKPHGANSATLTVCSTESSAAVGPIINLVRDDGVPQDDDFLGILKFNGSNSAGAQLNYVQLAGITADVTDGTEDGTLQIKNVKAGSDTVIAEFRSDSLQLLNSTSLTAAGDVSAPNFNSTSDIRYKTNIKPIDDPISKVIQIEGVSFNWKKDDRPALGVIADQVEKILPQLVHGDDPKTVNYNGLVGLLIEVVKDQQKQIDTLSERISKLE